MATVVREPDTSEWLVSGQPLEDAALRARLLAALSELAADLPSFSAPEDREVLSQDVAELLLDRALDHLDVAAQEDLPVARLRQLSRHVTALHRLHRDLADARLAHRSRAFGRVQEALARLHELSTVDQAMQRVAAEVLHLGFSRVILSRVVDGAWMPEIVLVEGDPEWGEAILAAGRAEPVALDHMVLETEMVRRRVPMLVRDVQNDPRAHRPIADSSFSRSYVTAPLMPEGRVIGFLHADCYVTRRDVDELDRDLLWMFAEGAGYAIERTVLRERLRDLRDNIRGLTDAITAAADQVVGAEVELARLERATAAVTQHATMASAAVPESRLANLLTRRELEVAQLLAAGHTNSEIARRLVISQGTVKTHVSNVLRKLRATNRTQAVAVVSRLLGRDAGAPGA